MFIQVKMRRPTLSKVFTGSRSRENEGWTLDRGDAALATVQTHSRSFISFPSFRLKRLVLPKRGKCWHHLLTLVSLQTCVKRRRDFQQEKNEAYCWVFFQVIMMIEGLRF